MSVLHNQNRARIELVEMPDFYVELPIHMLRSAGIADGHQSTLHILQLLQKREPKEAYHTAVEYLAKSVHTRYEVVQKLLRKGYGEEAIEETILKLIAQKYIDDETYVRLRIRNLQGKHKSQKQITVDLWKKGIQRQSIDDALYEQEPTELKSARFMAEKIMKRYEKLSEKDKMAKTATALARRGFSWEIIRHIIDERTEFESDELP